MLFFGIYLQALLLIPDSVFFTPTFLIYEFPTIVVLLLAVNFMLTLYFIYNKYLRSPGVTDADNQTAVKKVLMAVKGFKNIPVPVGKVAYIYHEGELNILRTFENEEYQIDASLDSIFGSLDHSLFFRANRQTIINLYACSYYSHVENGKLKVVLNPEFKEEVVISQKTAPYFRDWIRR